MQLGATMSWVTCLGLKPSAAVAERGSDEGEPGGGLGRVTRRREDLADQTWLI
jgi:hypothetical protein